MKITESELLKIIREELVEAAKRDYKAEYKKFQSSTKSKKYRAELNKYNRQKGTYGNGDGKDASHKGGKIVGFEKESVNRGRAEKSRLKKEGKLNEDYYYEEIAKNLVKKKKVRKGMSEDKLVKAIYDYLKRDLRDKKRIRYLMGYDPDFLSDTVSAINHYLKEGKLNELGNFSHDRNISLTGNSGIDTKKGKSAVKNFYQGYSSKEAKNIIDDGLKLWAKDLRKVQHRVIKDWMNKAKAGVIDYFDLVRGLKTGDVRRAHSYETDFLFQLLNKDGIIKRFRSYFGGKKGKRGRRK